MNQEIKNIFGNGTTIRSSRKLIPRSIMFSSTEARELEKGFSRCAVNYSHNTVAVGQMDNKAAHLL
jgi:hypothetical protein